MTMAIAVMAVPLVATTMLMMMLMMMTVMMTVMMHRRQGRAGGCQRIRCRMDQDGSARREQQASGFRDR